MAMQDAPHGRRGRKPKFIIGDRIIGREEGRASFRGRTGKVIEANPARSEYKVQFDDGRDEWVNSPWIERT